MSLVKEFLAQTWLLSLPLCAQWGGPRAGKAAGRCQAVLRSQAGRWAVLDSVTEARVIEALVPITSQFQLTATVPHRLSHPHLRVTPKFIITSGKGTFCN